MFNLDANCKEGEGNKCRRDHLNITETTPTGDWNNNKTPGGEKKDGGPKRRDVFDGSFFINWTSSQVRRMNELRVCGQMERGGKEWSDGGRNDRE